MPMLVIDHQKHGLPQLDDFIELSAVVGRKKSGFRPSFRLKPQRRSERRRARAGAMEDIGWLNANQRKAGRRGSGSGYA